MSASRKKGIGLSSQILIALILGVVFGLCFPRYAMVLKPVGDIFLRMIRMIVVPLIFSALVVGIAGTVDFKRLGRLSVKTFVWFEFATTVALFIGLIVANVLKPGLGVNVGNVGDISTASAAAKKTIDMMAMVIDIVPTNIVDSMAHGNLLQIVFFSVFFGVATATAGKLGEPVVKFADSVLQCMFHFTGVRFPNEAS